MGSQANVKRPNFLVIVADDLGFSDIGPFGGEIRTPALDQLSQDGVRFTQFYAAAACSPTRAMIMTGTDHHIAGLGNLLEWTNTNPNKVHSEKYGNPTYGCAPQRGMPGYEGYLNERVVTVSEILQDAGYHTILSGKWHLGLTPERAPPARGFNRSFCLLGGCANHYGYMPDLEEAAPREVEVQTISLHMDEGRYMHKMPDGWYSSNGYGDRMLQYLEEWKKRKDQMAQDDSNSDEPFFAYYPFTAPHWPLQAPREYVDHYRGAYDDGPEVLRQKRLKSLEKLGMIPAGVTPHPVVNDEVKGWDDMRSEEQKLSSRAMEAYAGMVECLDHNIGRVTDYLTEIGELDNTMIVFLSDNGAEGAAYEAHAIGGNNLREHIKKYYHNNYDNIGNYDSFVWYGPLWAQAATAPSRLYKGYTTDGGVRVPCLIRYPGFREKGEISHTFATVMDLVPTILSMAGVKHPAPQYKGREVVTMRGQSIVPWFTGKSDRVHGEDFIQGWELCGRGAIRKGKWKANFIPRPKGPEKWQLYDMNEDPGETNDLAEKYPGILKELLRLWDQYVNECGVVPTQPELGDFIEATEAQMPDDGWYEYEFWKPGALEDPEEHTHNPPRFNKERRPVALTRRE